MKALLQSICPSGRIKHAAFLCCAAVLLASCMDYGPQHEEDFAAGSSGVFITNEGNFKFGNASLSYYDPAKKNVENDVFARSNGMKLGDVAQSMVIHGGLGYIVVNESGVIYAIDTETFKVAGTISGLTLPRHMHILSDTKAYVTHLFSPHITIVNPATLQISGTIDTRGHKSTEQMA